jgi:glutamine synthetase
MPLIYLETPKSLASKSFTDLETLTPGMFGYSLIRPSLFQDFFLDIFDKMETIGIEIEGLHTETGPGVYEVALKYRNALEMADCGAIFKTSVKQIGLMQPQLHHGRPSIYPSFMAKPRSSLPGCSGHIHLSLLDHDGNNLFYDDNGKYGMSLMFQQFVAGILHCLPEILPMLAPTINSYKRLVENYWAPVKVCWGLENRTAALRVITPKASGPFACTPKSTRCEMRVSGADMNVHLAIAACFASGLYGIENQLSLPEPIAGDVMIDTTSQRLPKSLLAATMAMGKDDSVAIKIFGHEFVQHFVKTRLEECELFEREVTDFEVRRYFETV